MTATILSSVNSAVLAFIAEAVEVATIKNRVETYIHEFEDCQYFLCRSKADPECVRLSFKYSYAINHAASLAVKGAYQGFATMLDQPEADYQLTLQVMFAL